MGERRERGTPRSMNSSLMGTDNGGRWTVGVSGLGLGRALEKKSRTTITEQ